MSDAAKALTELVTTSAPTASTSVPSYFEALLSSLTVGVVMPLLIMGLAVALMWILIARAQKDPNFNIAEVLLDEQNKASSERILTIGTWVVSSATLTIIIFALPNVVVEAYVTYLGFWCATASGKAFMKHKYGAGATTTNESTTETSSTTTSSSSTPTPKPSENTQ
jgi:hypothetical protein